MPKSKQVSVARVDGPAARRTGSASKKTKKHPRGTGNKSVATELAGAAYGTLSVNRPPTVTQASAQVVRVQHREFITDVSGSVGFTVLSQAINPGVRTTFPWLSILARNFEKYRFRKLKFCYESSTSTFVAGMTMLAIDLDANDVAPLSKTQMMSYSLATRANVWQPHCVVMPEQQPPLYIRQSVQPLGTDIKTYDAGNLFFATSGEGDDSVIGELYVEYDVELHVPQLIESPSGFSLATLNLASTLDFTTATIVGSLPYKVVSATRIAIAAIPGAAFLVSTNVTAASFINSAITAPSVEGSTGTISYLFNAGATTSQGVSEVTITCNTVTNSGTIGAGYFVLSVTNTTVAPTRFNVLITPLEIGLVVPVSLVGEGTLSREDYVNATYMLTRRLEALELRLRVDDIDDVEVDSRSLLGDTGMDCN